MSNTYLDNLSTNFNLSPGRKPVDKVMGNHPSSIEELLRGIWVDTPPPKKNITLYAGPGFLDLFNDAMRERYNYNPQSDKLKSINEAFILQQSINK